MVHPVHSFLRPIIYGHSFLRPIICVPFILSTNHLCSIHSLDQSSMFHSFSRPIIYGPFILSTNHLWSIHSLDQSFMFCAFPRPIKTNIHSITLTQRVAHHASKSAVSVWFRVPSCESTSHSLCSTRSRFLPQFQTTMLRLPQAR